MKGTKMKNDTVYLLLADGFEETEALCPLDILRRGGVNVKTVGITGELVTGSHGICVKADILPAQTGDFSMLIFPGGLPGATNLDESAEVQALIEKAVAYGARMAAICAAPLILGKRGLLTGKNAVCYPGFETYLEGASISDARVVTDGLYTTAVGMGASAEFVFELLSLLKGTEAAQAIKEAAHFAL